MTFNLALAAFKQIRKSRLVQVSTQVIETGMSLKGEPPLRPCQTPCATTGQTAVRTLHFQLIQPPLPTLSLVDAHHGYCTNIVTVQSLLIPILLECWNIT